MFKMLFHRAAVAFHGFLATSADKVDSHFAKLTASLKAAEDRAVAHAAAEQKLQQESYNREAMAMRRETYVRTASAARSQKAGATIARASRVRGRLEELFA